MIRLLRALQDNILHEKLNSAESNDTVIFQERLTVPKESPIMEIFSKEYSSEFLKHISTIDL